jgi:Holliday junction DNA helicase RuvA
LLTELRDKAGAMPTGATTLPIGTPTGLTADAFSALANLGYRRAEAAPVIERVMATAGDAATLDAILRACLRELAR